MPRAARPPTLAKTDSARERLVHSALALFANHGYAKTSIREIADAAHTNVASISYYFNDKAGLYRAVFFEPLGPVERDIARFADPALSLEQALAGLYAGMLEPLKQGEVARHCIKLHFREFLEPTGLWDEEVSAGIAPLHHALAAVLCRHLGLRRPDDEVHRLAFAILGLGVQLHVGQDVIASVAPRLLSGARALDTWLSRLVMYARAMVAADIARRAAARLPTKATLPAAS